jgi:fumarate reductase subunit D
MLGSVAQSETVQIPLPLKPHAAAYTADGWSATGILPDGSVGSSIQLTRIRPTHGRAKTAVDKTALPPFLHVTRHLQLGTHWQVETTIERVTPAGVPVVASVPLLAEESLTTAGLHVEQGHALINMSPEQTIVRFSSTLQVAPKIELTAPRAVPWTESWVLNVSPIWRCEFSGLNAIHHQDETAHWQPQWKPWPGETLSIQISRPEALGGQTVTIQQVRLVQTPGRRHSQNELALTIRTSHGGQHTIELPSRANLQSVQIDKKSLPVQQDGQWVTFPLQPGAQNVVVAWNSLTPFRLLHRAPEIKIGDEAVNAKIRMNMPAKRWILLTGGPRWGPAVLFWSYLAVVALAAFGLSRISITPLKGWQWLLLGLGLTQVPVVMSLFVVGWLLAMGLKERQSAPEHWLAFNAMQFGMIALTLFALICLFAAIHAGLIGQPEMQIAGNGSSEAMLNWTQDRVATSMPRPWVVSLPVWVYRCLMLAWSLWLALSLLAWLKWGWQCYAKDGLWRKKPPKPKKGKASA